MIIRAGIFAALMGAVAAATAPAALAAAYPDKPIKVIVPFRAGGGSDALARTLQAAIKKYNLLPQPITVVNVPGAGGAIASRQVKDAKPDGYTYMQIHQSLFSTAVTKRVEYGPEAFESVIGTTKSCLYIAVRADSPFKTYQDLIAAGRATPGKIKQADSIGGISHFPSALLEKATGAKFGLVQTGGTSKRFASLKGGFTQFAMMSTGWLKRGGNDIRGILYLGDTRLATAPDMPTAKELGYDINACLVRRYWAPKGTPAARIKVFADAVEAALKTPELIAFHKKSRQNIRVRRGEALRKDVAADFQTFVDAAPLVNAAISASRK
jgi:putative tricarboxylic transport membrane protein